MIGAVDLSSRLGVLPPTEEQAAVIEAPLESALVVAGAGAGKTATMALRVAWLVANGEVAPGEVLGLTFTRKAAGELSERIQGYILRLADLGLLEVEAEDLLPMPGGDRPEVSTYNAYAAQIVRDYGILAGLDAEARLLSQTSRHLLAERVLDESPRALLERLEMSRDHAVRAMIGLADGCREHLVDPARLGEHLRSLREPILGLPTGPSAKDAARMGPSNQSGRDIEAALEAKIALAPLVERFTAAKAEAGVMDFGDQVAAAASIATALPGVGMSERERWRVVLLDEYQDTSHSQFVLLSGLFAGHPVIAVGDPRQSIYGWRGASEGSIRDFPGTFTRPDGGEAHRHQLTVGFRNDEAILRGANAIAARLPGAAALDPLVPRPGAGPGRLEIAAPAGAQESELHGRLADWAAQQHARGASCAILCRSRAQFAPIERALSAVQVPWHTVGTDGLLEIPEIATVVAVLRAIDDPEAGTAAIRLIGDPALAIGAADVAALHAHQRSRLHRGEDEPSLLEALDDLRTDATAPLSDAARGRLGELAMALHRLRHRRSGALTDLIRAVVEELRIDIELDADPALSPRTARSHLEALIDHAAEFERSEEQIGLSAFLAWLATAADEDRGLSRGQIGVSADAVLLMTIHASKGLEFDAVAVPDLVASRMPGRTKSAYGWFGAGELPYPLRGDREHLPELPLAAADWKELQLTAKVFAGEVEEHRQEEERRLFYVAVTRAARSLWLGTQRWGAGVRPLVPSPDLVALAVALDIDLAVADDDAERPDPLEAEPWSWPVVPDPGLELSSAAERVRSRTGTGIARLDEAVRALNAMPGELSDEVAELLVESSRSALPPDAPPLTRISPTALVALHRDPTTFTEQRRRPMPASSGSAARIGTALHAWVESYYGQASLAELDELGPSGRSPVPQETLDTLRRGFVATRFAERAPKAIELGFELSLGGVAVSGSVDAVFETPDGRYEVVDWKTGRVPEAECLADLQIQLAVYRLAFARWAGIDDLDLIDGVFCYLPSGEEIRCPDLPGEVELVELITRAPGSPEALSGPTTRG